MQEDNLNIGYRFGDFGAEKFKSHCKNSKRLILSKKKKKIVKIYKISCVLSIVTKKRSLELETPSEVLYFFDNFS